MKSFLKNNFWVLFIYFISVSVALFFMFSYKKTDIHIYLNRFVGNKFVDIFFYYMTYLGDGTVAVFILLAILTYNVRLGIYTTASFLTASMASIILKNFFFDDVIRPWFVFHHVEEYPIRVVDGVEMYIHNSFPSGHATQAFGILMCLVFVSKNQYFKLFFFVTAMLTAISRVYLSQHWLADITAGSFIGTTFSILYYYMIIAKNKLQQLNKPLTDFKKS